MKVLLGSSLSRDLRKFFNNAARDGQIEIVSAQLAKYTNSAAFAEDVGDVKGQPVVIIQSDGPSGENSVNDYAMELAFAVDALKEEAGASAVWVVMPHFCYGRQDKSRPGKNDAIGARAFAKALKANGVDGFSVIEAHSERAMDHVRKVFGQDNVYNLDPSSLYVEKLIENGLQDALVGGPDLGSDPRADHLEALLHDAGESAEAGVRFRKHRVGDVREDTELDGMEGDIEGKDLIMVDDVYDSGGTMSKAGKHAKEVGGAKRVFSLAAGGTFSNKGLQRLYEAMTGGFGAEPVFDKIFLLDTVDSEERRIELERMYPDAAERIQVWSPGQLLLDHIVDDIAKKPFMTVKPS